MKKGHVYTLVFMVVLSAVLTFALAASYEGFKPAIAQNKALQEQRAVLYALGLEEGLEDSEIAGVYQEKIAEGTINGVSDMGGRQVLAHMENGQVVAYAVPFDGAALWGALRGYLGVTVDLSKTTGLVFTYQNETPGLGGRIDEDVYKAQFRGLPIGPGSQLRYGSQEGYSLDAVTGATQTSSAVLRTLNQLLAEEIFPGEGK